jgi:hypothetical protein
MKNYRESGIYFKRFRIFLILMLSFLFAQNAQAFNFPTDSAVISTSQKLKFVFLIDIRNSFLKKNEVKIYGATAGISFRNKHQFTLGYYTLSEQSEEITRLKDAQTINFYFQIELSFLSLGYTYTFPLLKKLDLSIPLEIGLGGSRVTQKGLNGETLRKPARAAFIPLQAGVKADLKLTRWIGINGSVGYRETLTRGEVKQDYDGLYYNYGLSIYLSNILTDIKKKK